MYLQLSFRIFKEVYRLPVDVFLEYKFLILAFLDGKMLDTSVS